MTDTPAPASTDAAALRRGDACLMVMQAQRAHRGGDDTPFGVVQFDEAHAIVEKLVETGFLVFEHIGPAPAASTEKAVA